MTGFVRVCACAAAFLASAVPAGADLSWSADALQSNVSLSVSELFIAKIRGTIPIASATIVTAGGTDASPLSIAAILNPARLDTGDSARDQQMRGDQFFDVSTYPTIAFTSEKITETGPQTFAVEGSLRMRGITRPLHLDGRIDDAPPGADGVPRLRYVAQGRFRRSDYGMTYLRGVVGNDVSLAIVLETQGRARQP